MINQRYKIERKIGEGRSAVYLCRDQQAGNKYIALKCLPVDVTAEEKAIFYQEYALLRRIKHPYIINAIDSGVILEKGDNDHVHQGSHYFTLEYFSGQNALSLIGCNEELIFSFLEKLSSALFYLHQSRIIYYDIKAENILINISNGDIDIRLIDFGLAHYNLMPDPEFVRGSREYIAPELLKRELHDHRVDLYSLGILLYRIVYNTFPFKSNDELEILREHLELEYDFPFSEYSSKLISIIKRLLEKDVNKRYYHTAELLLDVKKDIPSTVVSTWSPAQLFSNRNDALLILNRYINDSSSSDIIKIRGSAGAGKTSLVLKISELNPDALYISYNKSIAGTSFIRYFINKVLYSEQVYKNTEPHLLKRIRDLIHFSDENIFEEVKSIFSLLLQQVNILLLIDNINDADEYVLDLLRNIFPIFQVNNNKVIYCEDADTNSPDINLYNIREINLNPFTEVQLSEYLDVSLASFFPIESLKKVILLHADLLPGSIVQFIKDILVLNLIKYTSEGIKLVIDEHSSEFLLNSHEDIYRLRIEKLDREEIKAARIFSAIDLPLEESYATILLKNANIDPEIINTLQVKNVIQPLYNRNFISISSDGLKKYIYRNIPDIQSFHSFLSILIENNLPDFNKVELARQFELAGNYEISFNYTYHEISYLLKIAAYSYAKTLLIKLLMLPFEKDRIEILRRDLALVQYHLSSFNEALENIKYLENDSRASLKDLVLKASCLIGKGEYESGRNLLKILLPDIDDDDERRKIFIEVANAQYELNNYQEASEICQLIIENPQSHLEELGKCYSLLGLISIFMEGNMSNASLNFQNAARLYRDAGIHFKAAQMEMNLGNVYNMKGDHQQAETSWNNSLKIFTATGNLELEGKLQVNYGIYHFDKLHYEEACKYYNRALSIFSSLGNLSGEASVYYNLAELYFTTCEYHNFIEALNASIKIFKELKNLNAELECLFLLGKLYFVLGGYNQLSTLIESSEDILADDKTVEKNKQSFELLTHLINCRSNTSEEAISVLRMLGTYFLEQDDRVNYMFIFFSTINILHNKGEYSRILSELEDEKANNIIAGSQLYNAEKIYWQGIAAKALVTEKSSIEYFLEASEYLLEQSVFELTWKVFFNTAEEFQVRGNITKAEEFYNYSKSVLEFIFNNSSGEIRDLLLNDQARKMVWDRIADLEISKT